MDYYSAIKTNKVLILSKDEPWKHYKSKKPDTEGHRFHSMKCLEQGNPQRQKTVWWLSGARGMGERGATP